MSSSKFNRRKFITRSSAGLMGAGFINGNFSKSQEHSSRELKTPEIREYRTLGRTNFRVSDISSGSPSNEAVLRKLLDSGVNFIDTGEMYGNGNNEELIGRVIKDYDRKKIFIQSKLYTKDKFESKESVLNRTRKALERLGTDYVDCMGIHSADNSTIIKDEAFHAAMKQLKEEGRVRSVGVSCHGNNWYINTKESLEKILMTAVEDGRFDVFQLAYNFFNNEMAGKVLDACAQKGIGTAIMKSNPVAIYLMLDKRVKRLQDEEKEVDDYTAGFYEKYTKMTAEARNFFKDYGVVSDEELKEAATKFVLSNPYAHTINYDFRNFTDVDEVLGLSGTKLTKENTSLLEQYRHSFGHLTCRIGCSECEQACPHDIPINTIMRYNYYCEVKQEEKDAMEKYARITKSKPAEVCGNCPGYCEQACPHGVSTRALLASAEYNLGFRNSIS